MHTHTGCLKIKIIVCSSLDDPSFNGVSVIMCKVIHTDRLDRAAIPLCTTWWCVIIFHWSTYLHNLSVHRYPAQSATGCQYAQPATGVVTRAWWQHTAGWKPAGDLTCGVASLARGSAVVGCWSAELARCQHQWQLPATRSPWCWQGWCYWPPSGVVSGTSASTSRSTLHNWTVIS